MSGTFILVGGRCRYCIKLSVYACDVVGIGSHRKSSGVGKLLRLI